MGSQVVEELNRFVPGGTIPIIGQRIRVTSRKSTELLIVHGARSLARNINARELGRPSSQSNQACDRPRSTLLWVDCVTLCAGCLGRTSVVVREPIRIPCESRVYGKEPAARRECPGRRLDIVRSDPPPSVPRLHQAMCCRRPIRRFIFPGIVPGLKILPCHVLS